MKKFGISTEELEHIMKRTAPTIKHKADFTDSTMEKVRTMPTKTPFMKRKSTWALFAAAPVALVLVAVVALQDFTGVMQNKDNAPTTQLPPVDGDSPSNIEDKEEMRAIVDDINSGLDGLSDDEYSDSTLSDSALY